MKDILLLSTTIVALTVSFGTAPVGAQVPPGCPPGYSLYSDGQCYPNPQPVYPAPLYDVSAPVYQPPVVFDGFSIGIGLGGGYRGGGHGGGRRFNGGGHAGGGHGGGHR